MKTNKLKIVSAIFLALVPVFIFAQSAVPIFSDTFSGSDINNSFWNVVESDSDNVSITNSALSIKGTGTSTKNGVYSTTFYTRRDGDLVFSTDISDPTCSATGTTAIFGYGDFNHSASTTFAYEVAIINGTVNLLSFKNGVQFEKVSSGFTCTAGTPFRIKLEILSAGGAKLYVNNSTTAAAKVTYGTFTDKPIFFQSVASSSVMTFDNASLILNPHIPNPTWKSGTSNSNTKSGTGLEPGSGLIEGDQVLIQGDAPTQGQGYSAVINLGGTSNTNTQQTSGTEKVTLDTGDSNTGLIPCGYDGKKCTFEHLFALGQNIIDFLMGFSVLIATVAFVYAGFNFLTAAGDSKKIELGKKIFSNVLVGFIIVIGAYLVVSWGLKQLIGSEYIKLQ